MKPYQINQLEVNPSGVVPVVGRHHPGATPGLLGVDTSGVRNKNILQPWEMDFQYNPWFSSTIGTTQGDENGNENNQPGGLVIQ